jgi:NAD(P)-dependent dehydrogenase (short-subunit alcohol dehydrogenase family)
MSKAILVCGFGPGISTAVAEKFGAEGFHVGLVARNRERVEAGAAALEKKGVKAKALPADLADEVSVGKLLERARAAIGPITVLHWNAYGAGAGDVLKADKKELDGVMDVALSGLLAAVRGALPDMKAQKGESALLVTNGGLGYFDANVDKMAVDGHAMGLAVANAAKHTLVGLLSQKLAGDGVYVGEVVVLGGVKGTAFDTGNATIESSRIAGKFWELYRARSTVSADVG